MCLLGVSTFQPYITPLTAPKEWFFSRGFLFFEFFFFLILNSLYFTNHPTFVLNFFTSNITQYLPHFVVNQTSLLFLVLKLEFFKNSYRFFENKKSKYLWHSPSYVLDRQLALHESTLFCSTCGMKEVLLRRNTQYV